MVRGEEVGIDIMEYYYNLLNSFNSKALNRGIGRLNLKKDDINTQIDGLLNRKKELESQINDIEQSAENYKIQISDINSLLSTLNCKLITEYDKSKKVQIRFLKISIAASVVFACVHAFVKNYTNINYIFTGAYVALIAICILVIVKNRFFVEKGSKLNNKLTLTILCEDLQSEIQEYNKDLDPLEENIKRLEDEISEIEHEIHTCKLSLNEANTLISRLEEKTVSCNVIDKFNEHSSKIEIDEILNYIFNDSDLKYFYCDLSKYFGYSSSYEPVQLITNNESEFYDKLRIVAVRKNLHIESKVKLSDIIEVGNVKNRPFRDEKRKKQTIDRYLYRINSKHIDFVLFNYDFYPVLSIEVDDSSHFDRTKCSKEHIKSHITKDIVFSYCNMSLLRIDSSYFNFKDLEQCVERAIKNNGVSYFYSDENLKKFKDMLNSL